DLAHQMALADSADRGITGHLADMVEVEREHESARAHPGRGEGGFDSGMAGADHDNVVEHGTCLESDRGSIMARRPSLAKHAASMFHVKHRKRGPAHADGSLRAE